MNSNWLYERITGQSEHSLNVNELSDVSDEKCSSLSEYEEIGAYNWSTNEPCTIIVPGRARIYNQRGNLQLRRNKHKLWVDENAGRYPSCPLEPLFRAVKICSPKFKFDDVDFVTDRNILRKLLDFVEQKSDKSFRVDLQRVGNLIVFIRKEEETERICDGYGKDFEDQFTIDPSGASNSDGSHRRVVNYKFGKFNMVVRFEVDCVLEQSKNSSDLDRITSALGQIEISTKSSKFKNSSLSYMTSGEFRPESLVELTTKSTYNGFSFPTTKWGQMFFSRTDNLVVGWHERGMLVSVEKLNFEQVSKKCENTVQSTRQSLNKLHDLLSKIKEFILEKNKTDSGKQMFSIVFDVNKSAHELKLYKCSPQCGISSQLQDQITAC